MRYVGEPDVITVALKGNNTYQIVYTGNSSSRGLRPLDVAMDGAGVRSANMNQIHETPDKAIKV